MSGENLGPFVAFGDVVVPVASFVSSRLVLVETPPQPLEHRVLETSRPRDASAFRGETRGALRGFDRERDEPSVAESAPFAYHDAPRAVTFAPRLAAEDGGTGLVVTLAFSASLRSDPGVATPASACRVGTIGPLVGAPRLAEAGARFAATTCVSPASKPGDGAGASQASSLATEDDDSPQADAAPSSPEEDDTPDTSATVEKRDVMPAKLFKAADFELPLALRMDTTDAQLDLITSVPDCLKRAVMIMCFHVWVPIEECLADPTVVRALVRSHSELTKEQKTFLRLIYLAQL